MGAGSTPAGFRYDANGFLIGMRSVNGIETTFQPDERNRLKQISSPPLTLTYVYTPGGNVAGITDASSGEPFTLTYGYDGANRLISAQVHMPTGIETVQYVYDALGNRIKEAWTDARGVINYGYRPGNYLVQRGSTSYSWGTYGQLILKDDQPNVLGGETNFDYNARRLMTQVRVNGSPVAQFFYDPYGRRVKIVQGDTTAITLYSGNDIVYEVKLQPSQPTVTTKYLAINGKYLAKVVQKGTNQPQTYFYHVDLVGSVRAITDTQGQVVARFEYEPFGVTTSATGPMAGSEVHKFTGKPQDSDIELYYLNDRYYDPVAGRFISRDQATSGLNPYEYCLSNPIAFIDPDGREVRCPDVLHQSRMIVIINQGATGLWGWDREGRLYLVKEGVNPNGSPFFQDMLVRATKDSEVTFVLQHPAPSVDPRTSHWYGSTSIDFKHKLVTITMSGDSLPATSKVPKPLIGVNNEYIDTPAFVILAHELGEGFEGIEHWEEYLQMPPHEANQLNHNRAVHFYENEVRRDVGLPLRKYRVDMV
ncbi:MAG TPA: hypothetical protein GXX55_04960 [Firmicutes bacterium]|nr:hypothetical protein [Bacillota bacterium]